MQKSRSRSGQVTKGHLLNGVGATHVLWVILPIESNGGIHFIEIWATKGTLRLRSGQDQGKSGQILNLVVWTRIEVYSIQLSIASSAIPFSSLSVV